MKILSAMGRSGSKGEYCNYLAMLFTLFLGKTPSSETDVYMSPSDDLNCITTLCFHDDKVMTDVGNNCYKKICLASFALKFDFFVGFWTRTPHLNCVSI